MFSLKVNVTGTSSFLYILKKMLEELTGIHKELKKMNRPGKAVSLNLRVGNPE